MQCMPNFNNLKFVLSELTTRNFLLKIKILIKNLSKPKLHYPTIAKIILGYLYIAYAAISASFSGPAKLLLPGNGLISLQWLF